MPFDVRCPECSSRLRLDDKPSPREEIECPKCGSTFTGKEGLAAAKEFAEEAPKKKPAPKPKPEPEAPQKKKVAKSKDFLPRDLSNPLPILAIIAASFFAYIVLTWFILDQIGKAGRVEDMIGMVPAECNWNRGANLRHLARYPGYKDVLDRYAPANIRAGLTDIATAAKLKEEDGLDYLIVSKSKPSAAVLYVLRLRNEYSQDTLAKGLEGSPETIDGEKCFRLPAKGENFLSGGILYMPTRRHVVVAQGIGQDELIRGSIAARKDKKKSLVPNLTDAGQLAVRGHTWVVIRRTGGMEQFGSAAAAELSKDAMRNVANAIDKSKVIAAWNSFGANIRFGYAIDCGTESTATSLAKNLKDGPMGKGDDSEAPNSLKQVAGFVRQKEFGAFMSDLSYRTSGSAGYLIANMSPTEKGKQMLQNLNLQNFGDSQNP